MVLTIKQHAFAMAYIDTGNASEAYRRSYDADNMAAHTALTAQSRALTTTAYGSIGSL
jgi:phage terminase small subunit